MKKKVCVKLASGICLVLVLGGLLLMPACAKPAPEAPPKPITLTLASYAGPEEYFAQPVLVAWSEELEERTNGRYKVEIAWAGAMGPLPENYDMVRKGIADIAVIMPVITPGVFPVTDVIQLPIIIPDYYIGCEVYWEMYKRGYLDKEYADVEVAVIWGAEGSLLYTAKEPINTLADLKGKKIGIGSAILHEVTQVLGAVPVFMGIYDYYMALQKGTLDGVWFTWAGMEPLKTAEVVDYALASPLITSWPHAMIMNKETYSQMPEDVKAIVDEMRDSGRYTLAAAKAGDAHCTRGREFFLELGGKITELSAADMAELDNLVSAVWDKFIPDMEAQGVPVKKILAELYPMLIDLGVEKPFLGYTP